MLEEYFIIWKCFSISRGTHSIQKEYGVLVARSRAWSSANDLPGRLVGYLRLFCLSNEEETRLELTDVGFGEDVFMEGSTNGSWVVSYCKRAPNVMALQRPTVISSRRPNALSQALDCFRQNSLICFQIAMYSCQVLTRICCVRTVPSPFCGWEGSLLCLICVS